MQSMHPVSAARNAALAQHAPRVSEDGTSGRSVVPQQMERALVFGPRQRGGVGKRPGVSVLPPGESTSGYDDDDFG